MTEKGEFGTKIYSFKGECSDGKGGMWWRKGEERQGDEWRDNERWVKPRQWKILWILRFDFSDWGFFAKGCTDFT